uniref:Uncharacterized protein n=1 Tax=Physcomitrium patens TaxID=3218 RepID=A0A2K1ICB9_PHYPA|nr:hypothetical protein PHYPA_030406 [Physcomitrium patens]
MERGLFGSTRMSSRTSTRHGPNAPLFQGRVRRWNKSLTAVAPSCTASAAVCSVVLYKWCPVAVVHATGSKESTSEELTVTKSLRFLPLSVVLHQKNEQAQEVAEDIEALVRFEEQTQVATNVTHGEDEIKRADSQQVFHWTTVGVRTSMATIVLPTPYSLGLTVATVRLVAMYFPWRFVTSN